MAITKEQQRELANMARKANRRLERASEGQRRALDHYIREYTTKETSKGTVFSQGKAKTEAEYRKRMRELEDFLGDENSPTISTRREWERVKRQNVSRANDTLEGMGFDITDDELAAVLEELPSRASRADYYRALENVQALKEEKGAELTRAEIKEAIASRRSDYQATLAALKARK